MAQTQLAEGLKYFKIFQKGKKEALRHALNKNIL